MSRGDDPKVALIALRQLTDDEFPWIEHTVMALARCADWNWAKIGRLLQGGQSSVRTRFNNTRIAMRPARQTFTSGQQREFCETRSDFNRRRRYESDDDPIAW